MPDILRFTKDQGRYTAVRLVRDNVEIAVAYGILTGRSPSKGTLASILDTLACGYLSPKLLREFIGKYNTGTTEFTLNDPNEIKFEFRVREKYSGEFKAYTNFAEAIEEAKKLEQGIINWDDTRGLCCLDVDIPGPINVDRAAKALRNLNPVPRYCWLSKSAGIHAIYIAANGLFADEIAAIASYNLRLLLPDAAYEIKKDSAAPPKDYETHQQTQALFNLCTGGNTSERDEWLRARNLEIGGEYEHTHCPFHPSDRGNGKPVKVRGDYIYCCYCAQRHPPGTAPYWRLCGSTSNLFHVIVDNFTHWGQARYICRELSSDEKIGKLLYSAALKLKHGNDPRIQSVFSAGEPLGLLRKEGYWTTYSGEAYKSDKASAILASLPAAHTVIDGEPRVDKVRTEMLAQTADLTKLGYPPLINVWGFHVTQFQQLPENKIYVLQRSTIYRDRDDIAPKYRDSSSRMEINRAWEVIEKAFPSIDRNAIRLLIAAKGCSEHKAGLPPMVFFTGPTGSGKTVSVKLASAICGDSVRTVQHANTQERIRQGLMEAKKQGSFCFFDEFLKAAKNGAKQDADKAMEIVLGFTPDSVSHALYIGPVALGELPVIVFADTDIPAVLDSHAQVGRRIHHVPYFGEHNWERTSASFGQAENLRFFGAEFAEAADSILSDVCDEFFPAGSISTDFADVANRLGFRKLRDSDIARERGECIRRFYQEVCKLPAISGSDLARWGNAGWKRLDFNLESEVADLWNRLKDSGSNDCSRCIAECSLQKLLNTKSAVRFETRSHGNLLVVRFKAVGQEIYNENLELESEQSSVNGSGDSISVQPQETRSEDLPSRSINAINECGIFG
jgi:hypothetical protein